MKYMGSKRTLLENGLATILRREVETAERFVDLFCGTGQVAWSIAESIPIRVLACDLQHYATVLAGAVVNRTDPIASSRIVEAWLRPAQQSLPSRDVYKIARSCDAGIDIESISRARQICSDSDGGPIWRSYGGHYYSPLQAAIFDHLIDCLPTDDLMMSNLCRAGLVLTASKCAAAPGHTAQPFQPTVRALPYIRSSWRLNPILLTQSVLEQLALRHARVRGQVLVAAAHEVAADLDERDVVFVDPPYSNVQYSRFYHVLETIARGECGPVSGVGRYPPINERPKSDFSLRSRAAGAIRGLLQRLAHRGCRVVLTFPYGNASNGVNGEDLVEIAEEWFSVSVSIVDSSLSTLGGNGQNRLARHHTQELVVAMRPR